jgi:serine/threonine protein kinase
MPREQVLRVGAEICQGLEKAHRNGIVHRDLKPSNVMLTKSWAKLMDFGLAKPNDSTSGSKSGTPAYSAVATLASMASPLTMAGTVVGTLQYMSPEKIQGKEADARSDIFSFGAMLYEMLTGKRAFEGKSQLSVASAILEKEPDPISAVQPMTPLALEQVVRTCLAKEPEERFQSAHDLKLQLQWIASVEPRSEFPQSLHPGAANRQGLGGSPRNRLDSGGWFRDPRCYLCGRAEFSTAAPPSRDRSAFGLRFCRHLPGSSGIVARCSAARLCCRDERHDSRRRSQPHHDPGPADEHR